MNSGTCTAGGGFDNASCNGLLECNAAGTQCLRASGEVCTAAAQCATGICVTLYLDSDYDGWGVADGNLGTRCARAYQNGHYVAFSASFAMSSVATDCCDMDPGSHPEITPSEIQPNNVRNACDSWDWNCDGTLFSYIKSSCDCTTQCTGENPSLQCFPGGDPGCGNTAAYDIRDCLNGCVRTGGASSQKYCD